MSPLGHGRQGDLSKSSRVGVVGDKGGECCPGCQPLPQATCPEPPPGRVRSFHSAAPGEVLRARGGLDWPAQLPSLGLRAWLCPLHLQVSFPLLPREKGSEAAVSYGRSHQSKASLPSSSLPPLHSWGCLISACAEESGPGYSQEPPLNRLITSLHSLGSPVPGKAGVGDSRLRLPFLLARGERSADLQRSEDVKPQDWFPLKLHCCLLRSWAKHYTYRTGGKLHSKVP